MLVSQLPTKIVKPFGSSAGGSFITSPIPVPSQTGINPNNASLTDGFPPNTFAGGGFPRGQDMNGILKESTAWNWWQAAGGPVFRDSAFSSAVGGYPKGALVMAISVPQAMWLSLHDSNTVDPDLSTETTADWFLCQFANSSTFVPVIPQLDYYVSTAGSDTTGDGLTPATAWKTVEHARATLQGYATATPVTIHVAAGTYNIAGGGYAGQFSNSTLGTWIIQGAGAATTTFVCTATGARGFQTNGDTVVINDVGVNSYYEAFVASAGGRMTLNNCTAASTAPGSFTLCAAYYSGSLLIFGAMTVSGSMSGWLGTANGGGIEVGYQDVNITKPAVINFSGVTCSIAVVNSTNDGVVSFYPSAVSWVGGTPTGARFNCATGGGITTFAAGVNFIPGSAPGTVNTGSDSHGWYS